MDTFYFLCFTLSSLMLTSKKLQNLYFITHLYFVQIPWASKDKKDVLYSTVRSSSFTNCPSKALSFHL